jgi:integrase
MRTHLLPAFGKRFLDQIDEPCVFDWFTVLSRTRGGAANRALSLLHTMFNKAEEWGQVPCHFNPCAGIEKNAQRVYRRYLSEPELLRLGRALDALEYSEPVQVGAIRLLLYTGCRKGEVLSLRWSDVAGRLMMLRDSKTGPRQVDLGEAAQEVLRRVPRQTGNPWIFPSAIRRGQRLSDLLPFWHGVVLPKAKIMPLRLHDLRHTFASHAAIQQENTPMIAKLLGHSGTDNTQRYMHLADQPALDAAELVSALIWDALTGTLACCADKEMPTKASKHLGRMVSLDAERSTAYLAS